MNREIPMKYMNQIFIIAWIVGSLCRPLSAGEIKHKFLATDESRNQLLYVDEFNPANDWTIPLAGNRDITLLSSDRFLVSVPGGYREYKVTSGDMVKEVIVIKEKKELKGAGNCWSVVRRADGKTYLGSKKIIYELDKNDKVIREITPSGGKFFRLLRMSDDGNFLFTSGVTKVRESDNSGELLKEFDVSNVSPDTKKPYFAARLKNGNTLISTGYGATIIEVDKEWTLLKKIGGKGKIEGMGDTYFFAQVDKLENGNYVIAHWTGHKKDSSKKAPQAIELDKDGKLVWSWHDPKRAGSLHGIAVIE